MRERYGTGAYLIGFGTDRGEVAAASLWDAPMEVKQVRPARSDSYEGLFHETGIRAFLLPLRHPLEDAVRDVLLPTRLERAIGVIYRPESELASHYFEASLPNQFDEVIFFDETGAVEPLGEKSPEGAPETWPFGA